MYWIEASHDQVIEGLESWELVDFTGLTPFAVNAFGDVFFESSVGVFFLDRIAGELSHVCAAKEDLSELLKTDDGKDHYLMPGLVDLAISRGLVLGAGECYMFKVPPVLNGPVNVDNLEKMEFRISLHLTGQIFTQVKNLPEGTNVTGMKLDDS